ncbi:aldehyde dehydrogenase family protein [Gemmobacter lanyuensis]
MRVAREVLVEAGLPADAVLLAVDEAGAEITKTLATDPAVKLIDYTGSSVFGNWLRGHAAQAQLFTEETGVNTVTIAATDDFAGMCDNLAFSSRSIPGRCARRLRRSLCPKTGLRQRVAISALTPWPKVWPLPSTVCWPILPARRGLRCGCKPGNPCPGRGCPSPRPCDPRLGATGAGSQCDAAAGRAGRAGGQGGRG